MTATRKNLPLPARPLPWNPSHHHAIDWLVCGVAAWIKEGLVDFVVPSDFMHNDTNMKTEDFVKLAAILESRDVMGVFVGHDHDDDVTHLFHYPSTFNNQQKSEKPLDVPVK